MDGNDSDGDADLLSNLLHNIDEEPEKKEETQPGRTLKELGFNFLENSSNSTKENKTVNKEGKSEIHDENLDSSDEEDKRYFEEQKYSDYGRDIKSLLKNDAAKKDETKALSKSSRGFDFNTAIKTVAGTTPVMQSASKDVYSDPFFGLRIISPLISSAELKVRMTGKTAVTVSKVKYHISSGRTDNDWVIAGVLVNKSPTKTSQKGSSYSIWKLTDLSEDISTVCLFMFSSAYKNFWKTTVGTVIGILNPNVMESKQGTDEATLSVDNPQKIMLLGKSKDMGKCKSVKKNGEPCTSIVNLSRCEYCVYHVKQEYKKCSRRAELQSSNSSFGFSIDMLKKKATKPTAIADNMSNFTPVFAVKNEKMAAKDAERLALLSGSKKLTEKLKPIKSEELKKSKAFGVELSSLQMKKDLDRLNKLRGSKSTVEVIPQQSKDTTSSPTLSNPLKQDSVQSKKGDPSSSLSFTPRLGAGCVGGTIDFSKPISKKLVDTAKLNALKWVRNNGKIKRQNPNNVRADKEQVIETGKKRAREEESTEEQDSKKSNALSDKFKEMLEAKSKHTDLIEKSDKAEEDKYFNKLEIKERMEEKMLTTYKVPCKAVQCILCKYTAFSSSDVCKEQKHPLRVIDAVKRFFKCGDCGNRTVSLDRIPSHSCKKCSSSNWTRAAMMDERKTALAGTTLSVRGGEEKFLGSTMSDANLNLLVPDNE